MEIVGNGSTSLLEGSYTYSEGEEIKIIANPANGWQFDGWIGEVTDPASMETTVVINSDKTVSASFSQIMHSLSIEVSGKGATNPEAGTYSHAEGTELGITAIPEAGWQFDGWSDEVADSTLTKTTVSIDSDKTVSASFSQIMHSLSIEVSGIDGWSGEVSNPTSATTTILIDADKTISASFSEVMPYAKIIGIIAGAVGAGLATLFATRRKKS